MGNEGNKTMEQKDAIHFPLSYLRERYASGGNEGGTDATGSRLLDQERSDMEGITRVNRAQTIQSSVETESRVQPSSVVRLCVPEDPLGTVLASLAT